jgi:hypothetical protein
VQALDEWVHIPGGDTDWGGVGFSNPYVTLASSGAMASDLIKGNVIMDGGKPYRIYYELDQYAGIGGVLNVRFRFRTSGSITTPLPSDIVMTAGVNSGYFDIAMDADTDDMTIEVFKTTGGPVSIRLNRIKVYDLASENLNIIYSSIFNPSDEGLCGKHVMFEIWDLSADDEAPTPVRVAYTDYMRFASNIPGNVFEFTSRVNYDGLIYQLPTGQEVPTFKVFIEGVFFHEREVTEEVSVDLTTEVVGTATRITTQKLLTVQQCPDELHRKVQSILSHGLIGKLYDTTWLKYWIKQEKYEKPSEDQHAALKSGSIYLTEAFSPKQGVI